MLYRAKVETEEGKVVAQGEFQDLPYAMKGLTELVLEFIEWKSLTVCGDVRVYPIG